VQELEEIQAMQIEKARGGAVVVDLIGSSTTESIFFVTLCL
jgi:hypothetical protein